VTSVSIICWRTYVELRSSTSDESVRLMSPSRPTTRVPPVLIAELGDSDAAADSDGAADADSAADGDGVAVLDEQAAKTIAVAASNVPIRVLTMWSPLLPLSMSARGAASGIGDTGTRLVRA
jgi:hypothetical protein